MGVHVLPGFLVASKCPHVHHNPLLLGWSNGAVCSILDNCVAARVYRGFSEEKVT